MFGQNVFIYNSIVSFLFVFLSPVCKCTCVLIFHLCTCLDQTGKLCRCPERTSYLQKGYEEVEKKEECRRRHKRQIFFSFTYSIVNPLIKGWRCQACIFISRTQSTDKMVCWIYFATLQGACESWKHWLHLHAQNIPLFPLFQKWQCAHWAVNMVKKIIDIPPIFLFTCSCV